MDEQNDVHRIIPELYFLIAKFLSGGPLKETAKTLLKELQSVEVLPRRLDWEGNLHTQSYEELASQYTDVSWDRLAGVCESALRLARTAALASAPPPAPALAPANGEASPPTAGAALPAPPSAPDAAPQQQDVTARLAARLSLLSESLVRPKPKYSSYKRNHSLVRRLCARELGAGVLGEARGAGLGAGAGRGVMSPRMLAGLQLQRRTLGHLSAVYCLVFDCTGRYVVTGADDLLVKVWSAVDGRLLATLRGAGAEITDVCASADGALLAAGSVERLVRVWCLATGAPRAVLAAHAGTITAVHWAPGAGDVRWLASTSTDGSVAFWTSSSDGQFLSRPVQYVERTRPGACHMICAAWSAGGGFLAAGSADHHVRIYMVEGAGAGGPRRVLEAAVHSDAVDSVAWAHRGLRLVSGSKDGSAALWQLHATQWRPRLLLAHHDHRRLKVTMVCWDSSDRFVMTAVSDNTIRVWCAESCAQVAALRGHRAEAYVLEAHPTLPGVLLSAGHDGQLFVWHAPHPAPLAAFHNHISGQGDGAIFDAKWGGACSIAASDSHGHLLLYGLGQGDPLLRTLPTELFFHTDYRPLVRDALGGALDEQTELPPHVLPPPFLVDVEGAPHAPHLQRLVPGRRHLTLQQLIPAPAPAPHAALDLLIQQLAAADPAPAHPPDPAPAPAPPTRGEGVRHTAGSWQRGDPLLVPHSAAPIVPPLPPARLAHLQRANAEMHALEAAWYRREMRRRPLMISTAAAGAGAGPGAGAGGGRRRGPRAPRDRAHPRPRPQVRVVEPEPEPDPEPESCSGSDTSDSSVRLSGSPHSSTSRPSTPTLDDCTSSSSSQYSDWEAGPPARARRRPLPTRRYSPGPLASKRAERAADAGGASTSGASPAGAGAGPAGAAAGPAGAAGGELPELYRVGEWLTAVTPRKAPYHPQMGDECLYFRLGHQRYFEAVAEKDLYKINPRDKPWERTHIHECELVKVTGIKYVIKPPRVACLRLSCALEGGGRGRAFTVRYHDMADVIDFLVLKQQYDLAVARRWGPGDRFRCMIDDAWWSGEVVERAARVEEAGAGAGADAEAEAGAFSAAAAAHFLSLKVRWDNGEVERLSPWDLEPVDPDRVSSEAGGAVPVLARELEAVLYRPRPHEWPPAGHRTPACRAIAQHLSQVMSLSVAEPFVAPVDLSLYPEYARVIPYPIDLATVRARFENLFYRRAAAAQFDVRYLASNAEQFNEPHSAIVRQARLVTDLLLHIIGAWRTVDVVAKYRELAATYHSSDDEPLARAAAVNRKNMNGVGASGRGGGGGGGWEEWCARVLRELMASADAEPFKRPVSLDMAPDYLSVVSQPMDLGTVESRLRARRYRSPRQFARDIRLVFDNSRLYNTNQRSRIYSMTVRLSALFESLWKRAPPAPRARQRRQRAGEGGSAAGGGGSDSSEGEPLAATSRRQHRARAAGARGGGARGGGGAQGGDGAPGGGGGDSWDSDAPLDKHRKGKGVGKKSKSSAASAEPAPGPSAPRAPRAPSDEVPGRARGRARGGGGGAERRLASSPDSESSEMSDSNDPLALPPRGRRRVRGARGGGGSETGSGSGSWAAPRHKRARPTPRRRRERFSTASSSESGDSGESVESVEGGGWGSDRRRYESDRSYKPRYSTDDDAPLHLYRQRQEDASEGDSSSRNTNRRKVNGHAAGVMLRARGSPRAYNEQSDSDSAGAISKRALHRRHRHGHVQLQRRARHAQNTAVNEDHNYFNGHAAAGSARPQHNGDAGSGSGAGAGAGSGAPGAGAGAVSISSRGRVRKLTAKARGLLRE